MEKPATLTIVVAVPTNVISSAASGRTCDS
jgi:hypothetical protein